MMTALRLVRLLFRPQDKRRLALLSANVIRCSFPMPSVAQRTPGLCPLTPSRTKAHYKRSQRWLRTSKLRHVGSCSRVTGDSPTRPTPAAERFLDTVLLSMAHYGC